LLIAGQRKLDEFVCGTEGRRKVMGDADGRSYNEAFAAMPALRARPVALNRERGR
jgi:hypothetical protein